MFRGVFMITRADKIIIAALLVVSLAVYCLFFFSVFGQQPKSVEIYCDGELFASYNLAEITEPKKVYVSKENSYNVVEITSTSARVIDASCADKIDVQCGEITKPGQMIVCAPNGVIVKLNGKNDLSVDKVTY